MDAACYSEGCLDMGDRIMINRRALLGAVASFTLTGPAAAAPPDAVKKQFMKAAINDIRASLGMNPLDSIFEDVIVTAACIPCPFADYDYYYTRGILSWKANAGQSFEPVSVPEGFCTDLTSIPQIFWSIGLSKTGRYAYAAIVHDYLYWTQTTTRETADNILYEAMKDTKVSAGVSTSIYQAVKLFGGSAWTANARAKAAGEKRILKVLPDPTKITAWAGWKKDPAHFES